MAAHLKNETLTIVRRPTDHNVVSTKFVWKLKNADTATPTYKARLVARGFTQKPGEDYDETFSPVPKPTTVRFMFALAAGDQLYAYQFDVETAFLKTFIDKLIYAEQPAGYHDPQFPPRDFVLQVNKGIPGLKQGAFLWSTLVKKELLSLKFRQSDADECLFIRKDSSGIVLVLVWVDDFLVLSDSVSHIDAFHADLSRAFTVKNLGPVKRFLSLDVYRPTPTGPISISQSTYARKVLHRFGMQDCNPAKAPFNDTTQLHKRRDDEEPTDDKLYREIVGSLGYLSTYTRADLSFAHSKLSQYLSDPSVHHMQAAKHSLRYLKGYLDLCICFDPASGHSETLLGYTDASHAADPDDRKSHSGNIFFHVGGSISHSSGKQPITALSSMESEYIGTTNAAQEAIFLRKLYASVYAAIEGPTKLLTDSEAARNHVKNNVQHSRTKHIDTRFHYIREVHAAGLVDLDHIPAAEQVADVLTKPLGITKHGEAIKQLRLTTFPFERL
jgi:hypothetical protein